MGPYWIYIKWDDTSIRYCQYRHDIVEHSIWPGWYFLALRPECGGGWRPGCYREWRWGNGSTTFVSASLWLKIFTSFGIIIPLSLLCCKPCFLCLLWNIYIFSIKFYVNGEFNIIFRTIWFILHYMTAFKVTTLPCHLFSGFIVVLTDCDEMIAYILRLNTPIISWNCWKWASNSNQIQLSQLKEICTLKGN